MLVTHNFTSDLSLKSSAPTGSVRSIERSYPRHQAMLWSQSQITSTVNLDLNLRYVDKINLQPSISAYTALDARLAWSVKPNVELSLTGHNLLDAGHVEFGTGLLSTPTEMPRELHVNARYSL